ncbi:MAG: O-acetyl-ADP-ribose deacetylase [Spirochaetales bacterium]|nr:O-acetyl-ADP-ribose deacetylase [Spirochaetales bacterium]
MIFLFKGDITLFDGEALVNAANNSLLGGGGVDGAIHRAGGPEILAECRKIGRCETGRAVITTGGNLAVTYVIHTVGPVWKGGRNNEEALLRSCYRSCLDLAKEKGIKRIAFPNISTGIYRFPKEGAAKIALEECTLREGDFSEIHFYCYEQDNYDLYRKLSGRRV